MEHNMTQKQALLELLKRIKKYWHLLIGSLLFALVYVVTLCTKTNWFRN